MRLFDNKALHLEQIAAALPGVSLSLGSELWFSSRFTGSVAHSGTSALRCMGHSVMELGCSLLLVRPGANRGPKCLFCSTWRRRNSAAELPGQQHKQWSSLLSVPLQVSKRELLSIQSSKATLNRLVERVRRAKEASAGLPYSENKGAGVDLYVPHTCLSYPCCSKQPVSCTPSIPGFGIAALKHRQARRALQVSQVWQMLGAALNTTALHWCCGTAHSF